MNNLPRNEHRFEVGKTVREFGEEWTIILADWDSVIPQFGLKNSRGMLTSASITDLEGPAVTAKN